MKGRGSFSESFVFLFGIPENAKAVVKTLNIRIVIFLLCPNILYDCFITCLQMTGIMFRKQISVCVVGCKPFYAACLHQNLLVNRSL